MKKTLIPLLLVGAAFWLGCNSSSEKKEAPKDSATAAKSPVDSLMSVIMEGHDVGMAKMGKLKGASARIQTIIDSIAKLPAKTKKALEPYRADLESSQKKLKDAIADMDQWMENFQFESKDEKYLQAEKSKVSTIRDNILNGLQRADSLIRTKL